MSQSLRLDGAMFDLALPSGFWFDFWKAGLVQEVVAVEAVVQLLFDVAFCFLLAFAEGFGGRIGFALALFISSWSFGSFSL